MVKRSPYILYGFLGIIVLGGLALFIFRFSAVSFLRGQAGFDNGAEVKIVVKKETLNTDILKAALFTGLRDNVINFHFDRICSKPVAAPRAVEVSAPGDNSTTTELAPAGGCTLSNSLPFAVSELKK